MPSRCNKRVTSLYTLLLTHFVRRLSAQDEGRPEPEHGRPSGWVPFPRGACPAPPAPHRRLAHPEATLLHALPLSDGEPEVSFLNEAGCYCPSHTDRQAAPGAPREEP